MGPLAIDMYLPALPTIARDLGTSRRGSGQPRRLFRRHRPRAGVLRPALRSDGRNRRCRRACVFIAASVGWRLADDVECADRVPFPPGAGRLRAARRAARHRPRLLRRARIGADAVDADAGDGAGADSGAARRRAAARALRLAIDVLVLTRLRRALVHRRRAVPAREPAGRAAAAPAVSGASARICSAAARSGCSWAMFWPAALMFAGLLAYISGSPFVFIELFRRAAGTIRPLLRRQRHRHHRRVADQPLAGRPHRPAAHHPRGPAGVGAGRAHAADRCRTPGSADSPASWCRCSASSPATASSCRTPPRWRWRRTRWRQRIGAPRHAAVRARRHGRRLVGRWERHGCAVCGDVGSLWVRGLHRA